MVTTGDSVIITDEDVTTGNSVIVTDVVATGDVGLAPYKPADAMPRSSTVIDWGDDVEEETSKDESKVVEDATKSTVTTGIKVGRRKIANGSDTKTTASETASIASIAPAVDTTDVVPMVEDNSLSANGKVTLRQAVTAFDKAASIVWNAADKSCEVTVGNVKAVFKAKSSTYTVDGKEYSMDNGAYTEILDDRMYIPASVFDKIFKNS